MKRGIRTIMLLAGVCALVMPAMAQRPAMPQMAGPSEMPFRAMSKEEIRFEKLSQQPYRPNWAPLPLLREHAEFVPALNKSLSSADAGARTRSAFLLGQIASPSSREPLARLLKDPNPSVRLQAGIALACMGDERGLSACRTALSGEPRWVKYYAILGLWNINTKQSKGVLTANSGNREVLIGPAVRGALKSKFAPVPSMKAQSKEASKTTMGQIWESCADVFSAEADWWWHKGDYEQAIRCHEAAILLDPGYPESYSIVAWLDWNRGRDAEAISALKRGIKAAPKNPDSYYNLGAHLFNTKRYAESEEYLRKAVQLGGDHLARRTYAHALEKRGKLNEALAQWKEIIKLRPNDQPARRMYDKIQARIGKR